MSSSLSTWSPAYNPDLMALYFVISLATTALPAFLYHGVYSADISHYSLVYILVILSSSALLTLGYKQAENNSHLALAAIRSSPAAAKKAASKGAVSAGQERITTLEAQAWAVFLVNALYSGVFLFLAFYVLKAFDVPYDYAVSSVVAAAIAWQVATAISK
jgi:hypothetical protein